MTKTYLAIAFLITGFLVGDTYGGEFDIEKAKSLGMPLLSVGAVIVCQSEEKVGFEWKDGGYRFTKFKPKKHVLKKIDIKEGCPGFKDKKNFLPPTLLTTLNPGYVAMRYACFTQGTLGEKPRQYGAECDEWYHGKKTGEAWTSITCQEKLPHAKITLSPNGFYHMAQSSAFVFSKGPVPHWDDPGFIEWGKCKLISR